MNHEPRTPLRPKCSIHLQNLSWPTTDEKATLRFIEHAANSYLKLVSALLDISNRDRDDRYGHTDIAESVLQEVGEL